MNNKLRETAKLLVAAEQRAYVRRVMWIDFEERLAQVFKEFCPTEQCSDAFGNIYVKFSRDLNPLYVRGDVLRSYTLNNAQVFTGLRHLGISHTLNSRDSETLSFGHEHSAAIVFSQNAAGTVSVILYPYHSDLAVVDEGNILLSYDLEPADLSNKRIIKYLEKFCRYCVATSVHTRGSFSDYAFRLWLLARDKRNRSKKNRSIIFALERILLLFFAALSLWVTLYTSSKWPLWQ